MALLDDTIGLAIGGVVITHAVDKMSPSQRRAAVRKKAKAPKRTRTTAKKAARAPAFHYYRINFHWLNGKTNKIVRDHCRLDAKNMDDAKRRTINGERKSFHRTVVVDKVVRL